MKWEAYSFFWALGHGQHFLNYFAEHTASSIDSTFDSIQLKFFWNQPELKAFPVSKESYNTLWFCRGISFMECCAFFFLSDVNYSFINFKKLSIWCGSLKRKTVRTVNECCHCRKRAWQITKLSKTLDTKRAHLHMRKIWVILLHPNIVSFCKSSYIYAY